MTPEEFDKIFEEAEIGDLLVDKSLNLTQNEIDEGIKESYLYLFLSKPEFRTEEFPGVGMPRSSYHSYWAANFKELNYPNLRVIQFSKEDSHKNSEMKLIKRRKNRL